MTDRLSIYKEAAMKKYKYPKIQINMFSGECVAATASAEQTYEEWAAQQRAIESVKRRFTALNEITKFNF